MGNHRTSQHQPHVVPTTIEPLTLSTFSYESSCWFNNRLLILNFVSHMFYLIIKGLSRFPEKQEQKEA